MVSSGDFAARSLERASAMSLWTASSCCAKPLVVSTRFGIRSLRRWSWFSTWAHCALMACSWLTKVLYEQPVNGVVATASATICIRALRVIVIRTFYQLEPPPPPPLLPPPNPPKPPPKPPPPPPPPPPNPPKPPPNPPPNGPMPLDHPPPPKRLRRPPPPPRRLMINMTRKTAIGSHPGMAEPR